MRKYVFIAAGGALGAVLRVAFKNIDYFQYARIIPVDTLLINILGSFLLGLFLTYTYERLDWHPDIRLGIATGFIGAFTTFSTFMYEGVTLYKDNEKKNAIIYIGVSLILGVTGYFLGSFIAGRLSLM